MEDLVMDNDTLQETWLEFRPWNSGMPGIDGWDPGIKIDLRNYHHLHWSVGYGKQRCMISAYKQRNDGTQWITVNV